jgi:hypothetical protein
MGDLLFWAQGDEQRRLVVGGQGQAGHLGRLKLHGQAGSCVLYLVSAFFGLQGEWAPPATRLRLANDDRFQLGRCGQVSAGQVVQQPGRQAAQVARPGGATAQDEAGQTGRQV